MPDQGNFEPRLEKGKGMAYSSTHAILCSVCSRRRFRLPFWNHQFPYWLGVPSLPSPSNWPALFPPPIFNGELRRAVREDSDAWRGNKIYYIQLYMIFCRRQLCGWLAKELHSIETFKTRPRCQGGLWMSDFELCYENLKWVRFRHHLFFPRKEIPERRRRRHCAPKWLPLFSSATFLQLPKKMWQEADNRVIVHSVI